MNARHAPPPPPRTLAEIERDLSALEALRAAWPSVITTLDRQINDRRRILRRAHAGGHR